MHFCQGRGSSDSCISSKASGGRVREPMQSVNDSWCFQFFGVFFHCFPCFQGRWKALKVLCCKSWIVVFLHSFSDKKSFIWAQKLWQLQQEDIVKVGTSVSLHLTEISWYWYPLPEIHELIPKMMLYLKGEIHPSIPSFFVYLHQFSRFFQGCIRWVQENTYCTFTTEPLIANTNKHQVDRNFTVGVFLSIPTPIGVRFAYTFRSN